VSTPSGSNDTAQTAADQRITVMVVDDHPIWRDGVARDLEEAGYRVVATAGDGEAAVRIAAATRPQVLVVDLQMPKLSGVEVTRQVIASNPAVRVLVLSASGEQADVLEAVKAGALGYLVKSASRAELVNAVARTAAGETVFTPGLAGLVLGEFRRLAGGGPEASGPAPVLTERETEVLRLMADSLPNRDIAARLFVTEATVKTHVNNIFGKLGVGDRAAAVAWAFRSGVASP
jgi:DNA-binding NarL/FixJ family response regulator